MYSCMECVHMERGERGCEVHVLHAERQVVDQLLPACDQP